MVVSSADCGCTRLCGSPKLERCARYRRQSAPGQYKPPTTDSRTWFFLREMGTKERLMRRDCTAVLAGRVFQPARRSATRIAIPETPVKWFPKKVAANL